MTNEEFTKRYRAALDADAAFEIAVKAAGFKSRWETPNLQFEQRTELREAYYAKIAADEAIGDAFAEMRLAQVKDTLRYWIEHSCKPISV